MSANAVPSLLQHVRRLAAAASSDEQLLADFLGRRGDEAFSALIGRHGPMVLNLCRRLLHDTHLAEDVFQATFVVLANRAGAIHRRASLAGFLHGVAYRLALRARQRRVQSLPAAVCDKAAGPAEGLAWQEMLGILDHELGLLPDRYRAPLLLCYLEGRTQDEAARQLGWSLNTLRRRLAQGRRLLEARLRGRGVTLSAALAGLLAASAVVVPGPLRAATLAAAGARAAGGWTPGAPTPSPVGKGLTFFLSASGKKVGGVVALAALAAAVAFGFCWAPPADQAPPAGEPPPADAAQDDSKADPLPAQAAVRLGTARYRHGDRIASMAVSADGKFAVTAGVSGPYSPTYGKLFRCAHVFDLTDGRRLYSPAHEAGREVEAVGLSPDGKTLAGKDDAFLYFWDAEGKELRRLNYSASGGSRSITDWITFTPDGQQVAVTLMGTAVQLIDVETGKVTRTFDMSGAARACVFSPDGKLMATGGYEQENGVYYARLWDIATGKEVRRFAIGNVLNHPIGALAFSYDGTKLAGGLGGSSSHDGRVRLFEVTTGKELKVFPKIGDDVRSVAFAPDGKTVAAAGDNIHLFDPESGKERLKIERRARGLAFSRDGSVLTGAVGGAVYRWDAASGRQLTPAAAQDSAVEQILVGANGRNLFTTDQDGVLYLWDAAGKNPPRRIAGGVERGFVASSDRRFLAWAAPADYGNTRIRLYDVAADRIIDPVLRSREGFRVIGGEATVAAFLPDGKSLLTFQAGPPPTYRVWDLESGKELRSFAVIPPTPVALPPGPVPAEGRGVPVRLWNV